MSSDSSVDLDIVFVGGRVIDPETGLDSVRSVGVKDGRITFIGESIPSARRTIDIAGLVLAPGFIDIHSHAQTLSGSRLQVLDGVTTALELEAGASAGLESAADKAAREGRALNYGFSASWSRARLMALRDVDPRGFEYIFGDTAAVPEWNAPLTEAQLENTLEALDAELSAGAIGIGVPVGFAPDSGRKEFFRVAQFAADRAVPMFVHQRHVSNEEPEGSLEGALEVIAAAAGTGGALHLCHLNSTSLHDVHLIAEAILTAQAGGSRVTTEAYPYTFSSTQITAKFLEPDRLHRMNLTPASLTHVRTGERINTVERLVELRLNDPASGCIVQNYDPSNQADMEAFLRAMTFPGAAIASDALPLSTADPQLDVESAWPPPPNGFTHPRSAGTFARALSWLVRDLGVMSLPEVIARSTIIPARIVADALPAARVKGRIQLGCDADIVVFDAEQVRDTAEFGSATPSVGFHYVMVGGELAVEDEKIHLDRLPGRWLAARTVRRSPEERTAA